MTIKKIKSAELKFRGINIEKLQIEIKVLKLIIECQDRIIEIKSKK